MGLRDDACARKSANSRAASLLVLATVECALSRVKESAWLAALPAARSDALRAWPDVRERHRSLLGTRLLIACLRRLGFANATLATLHHPPRQRPTLDLPIDFSLSHTEGLVVCAATIAGSVGIDVERVDRIDGFDAASFLLYLSPAERAAIGRDPHRFAIAWTRKEAIAKAAGSEGLAALSRIDTAPHPDRVDFAGRSWRTTVLPVGERFVAHVACVATEQPDAPLRFEWADDVSR